MKRKNLEALIETLYFMKTKSDNEEYMSDLNNQIIKYQFDYKQKYGDFYRPKRVFTDDKKTKRKV